MALDLRMAMAPPSKTEISGFPCDAEDNGREGQDA